MSLMFPDNINIIVITKDKYGVVTEASSRPSIASVEDQDTVRRDAQGTPIGTGRVILVPKNTTINIGDMVDITKLHGASPTDSESIRREVTQTFRVGGNTISHIELLTRSSGGK